GHRAALGRIGIAPGSATRHSLFALGLDAAPAPAAHGIAYVENRALEAVDRHAIIIAVCNRARSIDEPGLDYAAHELEPLRPSDRPTLINPVLDSKTRGVHHSDKEPASLNEPLEVFESRPTETGPDVISRVIGAHIGRQACLFPGQRVPPHRQA